LQRSEPLGPRHDALGLFGDQGDQLAGVGGIDPGGDTARMGDHRLHPALKLVERVTWFAHSPSPTRKAMGFETAVAGPGAATRAARGPRLSTFDGSFFVIPNSEFRTPN